MHNNFYNKLSQTRLGYLPLIFALIISFGPALDKWIYVAIFSLLCAVVAVKKDNPYILIAASVALFIFIVLPATMIRMILIGATCILCFIDLAPSKKSSLKSSKDKVSSS